ncbi:hypothetical protein LX36DRAFT_103518 [Colletotrichum falcatum]|nr:hypothetical protein LX36DRAFT_103518 [Colletotrichum falcatum]
MLRGRGSCSLDDVVSSSSSSSSFFIVIISALPHVQNRSVGSAASVHYMAWYVLVQQGGDGKGVPSSRVTEQRGSTTARNVDNGVEGALATRGDVGSRMGSHSVGQGRAGQGRTGDKAQPWKLTKGGGWPVRFLFGREQLDGEPGSFWGRWL